MTPLQVLIVGSGPVGATFARLLWDDLPQAQILMIDAGPRLTPRAGLNLKNVATESERISAQILSQGPAKQPYPNLSIHERAAAKAGELSRLARPGTHLVTLNEVELSQSGMPAAAMSTNIGGMGVHWTCACPRPGNAERISFIPDYELDNSLSTAEKLLKVSSTTFPETSEGEAIQTTLAGLFNGALSIERKVCRMPLACEVDASGRRIWSGSDTILGHLAEPEADRRFALRPETICRRLVTENDRITAAWVEHLPSGTRERLTPDIVIVAADALRTPQLLWASDIRPRALGHYLNDHLWSFAAAALHSHLVSAANSRSRYRSPDNTIGVFQVPFHSPSHPFHGQVMHLDVSPVQLDGDHLSVAKHVVGLGWSAQKEIQFEDCITFSDTDVDFFGMPGIHIAYRLTPQDHAIISEAMKEQTLAAAALGTPAFSPEPLLVPAGTSLHYQGSVRMGLENNGESVCDSYSRVWGFRNLFVGGNGVISTATACNPTLTSVALAVRAAQAIKNF